MTTKNNIMKVCKYCKKENSLIFGDGEIKDYQGNLIERDFVACLGCDSFEPEQYPESELILINK